LEWYYIDTTQQVGEVLSWDCEIGNVLIQANGESNMSATRIKQVLTCIGLLTIIGTLGLAGLITYLWWDAGRQMTDVNTDHDSDPDFGEVDFETKADDTNANSSAGK
jgi:hypothetical protein